MKEGIDDAAAEIGRNVNIDPRAPGVAHIDGPPVSQPNVFWRNVDHCGAPVSTTSGSANRSVVLITVDGHRKAGGPIAGEPYRSCAVVEKM
ncbi:hypothetical protein [Candidatus Mycobacterium methanotrophicum]|uniref:hypothetical protein n=1 Tax=Candidatus Mycobacterium methanotrophicum TaxID=2943498 RepID=UPI001C59F152